MLNLREPGIIRYPTESGDIYGSPSSTALTTVVMSDMATFPAGAEEQLIGKSLRVYCGGPSINVYAVSRFARD